MKQWIILFCLLNLVAFANQKATNLAYSIQVGSFKKLENAGNLAESLNKKGLDAFFFKENDMYKVRFGNYKDSKNAKNHALKLQQAKIIDEFIIINPQSYAMNQNLPKQNKVHTIRTNLAKSAHQYLGVPYKWGGVNTSGFDCSGLVRAVYKLNGITLPRISKDQFNAGKFVSQSKLQVGDLVFFSTNKGKSVNHVGIYIGNGKFIHAPGKGKKVMVANLHANYWKKTYKGARDYLKN